MQFNTRTAMLRGLELRKRLGSWEAVERLGQPVDDIIDVIRPASTGEDATENGIRPAE